MAEENFNLPGDQTIEYHIITLFEKIENLRTEHAALGRMKLPMRVEIRSLEFWRSVTSECLASFIYVFIVCGAAAGAGVGASLSSVLLATALAAGFAITSLTQCFAHISGAQINPAVTIALGVTKRNTFLRTVMFIAAQCGGGIAGAAFLYGVTVPGYQGNLSAAVTHSANIAAWERFGIEFILTFVIVFVYFVSMDTYRKWISTSSITLGATYSACTFVSMPYLNPARSLGPSFVLNRWESHWVYWIGPIIGGIVSGLTYEFILNPNRQKQRKESTNGDCSSIRSDEDAYDDLDKQVAPKFDGSSYNTYRAAGGATGPSGYCPSLTTASLYSAPPAKLERVESLYGGTKSLYCKSPPLTRANLNRSQSVYTKSNSGVHRDVIPKPGPLVPAQSLYPMRLNQTSHVQNQNVHNQLQQRSESIYGVRGVTPGTVARTETYGGNGYRNGDGLKYEEKAASRVRPESVYGLMGNGNRRGQSAQSDDSSYGSYHGSSARNNGNISTYAQKTGNNSLYGSRGGNETKQSPSSQLLSTVGSSSYHHSQPQESPNSHY